MTLRAFATVASLLAGAQIASLPAAASNLPAIKVTKANQVPACATPGRLMSFLKARNPRLDPKFDGIAVEYMRHGEALGIRWDIAFFQMLVETGSLTFKGDVKPSQNNFAGLGATGNREPGESFADVSTGARAHLEHVLMYAGEKIENPTAERTRKVQEWGVLTSWQKSIRGPMTFTHLTRKWSPKDRGYSNDIRAVATSFTSGECRKPDPQPELVDAARGVAPVGNVIAVTAKQETPTAGSETRVSGAELARRAVEEARANGDDTRHGLGAGSLAAAAKPSPPVTLLNAEPAPETKTAIEPVVAAASAGIAKGGAIAEKSVAEKSVKEKGKSPAAAPAPAAGGKCRVWQASYGGAKAVIIKAVAGADTNYTVLDVNDGAEKREAEAYIAAYAKGGHMVAEFPTSNQALDKAFELCPEG